MNRFSQHTYEATMESLEMYVPVVEGGYASARILVTPHVVIFANRRIL